MLLSKKLGRKIVTKISGPELPAAAATDKRFGTRADVQLRSSTHELRA